MKKSSVKDNSLFSRIIEATRKAGAEASETATTAGTCYYDGTQHGEIYPIVFVSIDKYKHAGNAYKIAMEARKAAGRFRGVTIKEVSHPSFYIYHVYNAGDAERAEKLREEAQTYLEALHQERHRQLTNGEPDDHEKAIAAGHAALKAAGYTVTA